MSLIELQSLLSTLWVVWFFILFGGIVIYVMRPSKRQHFASLADIPFRDEAGDAPRSRRATGPERESGRQTNARSI